MACQLILQIRTHPVKYPFREHRQGAARVQEAANLLTSYVAWQEVALTPSGGGLGVSEHRLFLQERALVTCLHRLNRLTRSGCSPSSAASTGGCKGLFWHDLFYILQALEPVRCRHVLRMVWRGCWSPLWRCRFPLCSTCLGGLSLLWPCPLYAWGSTSVGGLVLTGMHPVRAQGSASVCGLMLGWPRHGRTLYSTSVGGLVLTA